MITISKDTWEDLHTDAASPIAREEITRLLKIVVENGIPVWLTDEEGQKLKKLMLEGGRLNIND
nr:hypothetical protein [Nitrosomonas nitrosa]